jgi:SAM-dependent methyltransferase
VPIPGAPFDAAGAFFNTLNHLPDAAALERALAAVAGALRPGALVAFDLNNVAGYQRWWGGQQRYQGPGWQLEVTSTFDRRTGQAHARLSVLRDGARVDAEVAERLFSDGEVGAAVEAAGFVGARASPWAAVGDDFAGTTFWTARRSG